MIRVTSVNVNGVRAAVRKGMRDWVAEHEPDFLALQEVRAARSDLETALPGWHISNDEAVAKGRAGVALLAREAPLAVRSNLPGLGDEGTGRWLETDHNINGKELTIVNVYVHSGEVGTERQEAKWRFLDAMTERMQQLQQQSERVLIVGDLNVGHRELDIKNWRGNVKRSGFLPRERGYFDRFFAQSGAEIVTVDGITTTGLGWVDIGRTFHGEVPGPYTWWSNRGQAFDKDTGWRIDYHAATPTLAASAKNYQIGRAASYDTRWSDHAPVTVDYDL